MKRSQKIDLLKMRKSPLFKVAGVTAAVAAASTLTGCSNSSEESYVFSTVSECIAQYPDKAQICEEAYEDAAKAAKETGPKFDSQSLCEAQFGPGQCSYDSTGSFWMPFLAGYLVGEVIDEVGDYFEYKNRMKKYSNKTAPIWIYSGGGRREYVGAGGSYVGSVGSKSVRTSSSTYDSKPKSTKSTTRTISRGGFGSTAKASSSRASSSRSWGG